MSLPSMQHCRSSYLLLKTAIGLEVLPKRYGHHLRGKAPGIALSIDQRLKELNRTDPELTKRIDIGLPLNKVSDKVKQDQIDI